jgi:hypothetical protein
MGKSDPSGVTPVQLANEGRWAYQARTHGVADLLQSDAYARAERLSAEVSPRRRVEEVRLRQGPAMPRLIARP